MPKAEGYKLNVVRLSRDLCRFEFTHGGVYIRRTATMDALAAFLLGTVKVPDNLPPDAHPTTLAEFASENYICIAAKARLPNPESLKAEEHLASAVSAALGKTFLHEVRSQDAEEAKEAWLKGGICNNSIKKRLNCLRRIMGHAESLGLIVANPIRPVKGLPVGNRSHIWLPISDIFRLWACCPGIILMVVKFMTLTGARINEALDMKASDIRGGYIYVPTEKRGKPMREFMRRLNIESLGPQFGALLSKLHPDPISGFLFPSTKLAGRRMSDSMVGKYFKAACIAAGLDDFHAHDLRGSFTMHRAMVVKSFRQLQAELGHGSPHAIESYLARAEHFDPTESVFYMPPTIRDPASPAPEGMSPIPSATEPKDAPTPPILH